MPWTGTDCFTGSQRRLPARAGRREPRAIARDLLIAEPELGRPRAPPRESAVTVLEDDDDATLVAHDAFECERLVPFRVERLGLVVDFFSFLPAWATTPWVGSDCHWNGAANLRAQ